MVRHTTRSGLPRDKIMDVLQQMKRRRTEFFKVEQRLPATHQVGRAAREMNDQLEDLALLLKARLK